jgi:hypothetical protein
MVVHDASRSQSMHSKVSPKRKAHDVEAWAFQISAVEGLAE